MIDFLMGFPPFSVFFIGALLLFFCRGIVASIITIAVPVISFILLLQWEQGTYSHYSLMGIDLNLTRIDRLSLLFAYLFHLAALIGCVFALHVKDKTQQISALAYAGSAIGAVFAGDWISLFIFWELLALTSVFLVWASRTSRSYHSGMRYVLIQVLSGVLLFAGALVLIQQTGSAVFGEVELQGWGAWLIFIAFGIKCGFPFFHTWITDAYPEATPTGSIFLCAITTKVAVYSLIRSFTGEEILITIGLVMALFPIFFALIENDLRRVLSYSIINQIGFMVCGIGIGTDMAINGAVATAFNHVIYKSLLMMSMGAVLLRVGHVRGSDLGGLYRSMPKTTVFCIIGAASIAVPLFSGFVSKSLIMLEMLESGHTLGWLLLLFATAGTFHLAGIKIPFFTFFSHDSGLKVKEAPTNMLIAMGLAACLCIFIGWYPDALYSLLPFPIDYSPYDVTHVLTQMQLLCFSALAFIWLKMKGLYPPCIRSVNLDSDYFYRRFGRQCINSIRCYVDRAYQCVELIVTLKLNQGFRFLEKISEPNSILARGWGISTMLILLLIVMSADLLFNYIR